MKYLFSTLKRKIFFIILIVFVFFLSLFSILELKKIEENNFKYFKATNQTIQKILYDNIREALYKKDTEYMLQFIRSIENDYIKGVHIVSRDNRIIVSNDARKQGTTTSYTLNDRQKESEILYNNDVYTTLKPFLLMDVPLAYLVLEGNIEKYKEDMQDAKIKIIQASLGGFWIILLLSYLIAGSISKPMEGLVSKLHAADDAKILDLGFFAQTEFNYLSRVIETKHNTLQDLNVDLGLQVLKQTNALQMLNESLEDKIEQAVKENTQKDKQMLQQSRLAQMGEMLSMIAHQWRQPLAAISSTSSAIELKAVLGQTEESELIESAQNISTYSQHLSSTIDDFRDFFKDNKTEVETTFDEIIDSVLNIVKISLENKGIMVELNLKHHDPIKTFPNKIKQVILNLIKNAEDILMEKNVKYAKIVIRTYKNGTEDILCVSDNGGGISKEVMPSIFDPYFTTKSKKDGTGLGLYMSKTIIEEHCKGQLNVQNIESGVEFMIALKEN